MSELQERVQAAVGSGYRVERELGGGGMSRVYLATEVALGRSVVIKLLAPELTSEVLAARFRREFQVTAVLGQHPHILPVLSTGTNGGLLYFITPYIEGESLRHRLRREGRLQVEDAVRILTELGSALAFAHEKGIVHRDLKPENVLIDRYRRWRITDFGIAKGEDEQAGATGTPAFAAPEQLLGEAQGPAVDCFGVAAIIYYVLAGMPPFDARDTQALLAQQLGARYDESLLPPPLQPFIKRGLSPDPTQRFSDAGTMKEAWREVVEEMEREARRGDTWWGRVLG